MEVIAFSLMFLVGVLVWVCESRKDKKVDESQDGVGYMTVQAEPYCPECGRYPETSLSVRPINDSAGKIEVNFVKKCLHCGTTLIGRKHYVYEVIEAIEYNDEFIEDWREFCENYKGVKK